MSLTEEKIAELKEKYGKIFKIVLGGQEYVYRPLLRGEFKEIQVGATVDGEGMFDPKVASIMEEGMIKKCIVYPESVSDLDKLPAGVPAALAAYISDVSGFNIDSEPVEL
jgi:hypothetical protein